MRYYSYSEYGGNDNHFVVTKSEEDIRQEYYPWWYEKMCQKYGKEVVDRDFSFEECLIDWAVVNWAWEVTDEYS